MVIYLGWPSPATSSSLPAAPLRLDEGLDGVGHTSPPIWPCSDWGLPCPLAYAWGGGLLPHRFTLTFGRSRGLRRFLFCGPVRRLAAPRRYLAVYPVELGLSSGEASSPATIASDPCQESNLEGPLPPGPAEFWTAVRCF